MYIGKQKHKKAGVLWEGIFGALVMVGNLLPQYFFADAPPASDCYKHRLNLEIPGILVQEMF